MTFLVYESGDGVDVQVLEHDQPYMQAENKFFLEKKKYVFVNVA